MPSLIQLDGNVDQQSFPGATFVIEGEVPEPQCSEAQIEGDDAWTISQITELQDAGAFVGFNLADKHCTIISSVGGNTGTFDIRSNTDNALLLFSDPGTGHPVEYYCHNGGSLILTRNVQSFAEFIRTAGYSYTIKGGKLYTNIPSNGLQPACSILFDPLT